MEKVGYTAHGIGELSPPNSDPYICTCEICGDDFEASFSDEEICDFCQEYFETLQKAKPELEHIIELLNIHGPTQLHDCLGWINQELSLWEE